jgi:aspartyl-tRNA(Asn)/glutamyl-tRNA(Gln) amidotransferase subunit B
MYQSFVYLEVRILLPPVSEVFLLSGNDEKSRKITVNSEVMRRVFTLARSLGCCIPESAPVEHLTGNIVKPTNGRILTGYSVKVAEGGSMNIMFHCRSKTIHIEEVRIEEDTGRLTHAEGNTHMDFTWAGCPSIRVHTTPSFETGEEAQLFLDELRRLSEYLHLTNENADGAIRCNAFAALSEYPELPDYYVKLRNLNSFNFVRKAINSELTRQENLLSNGETVGSESRLWNETKSCTQFYQARAEVVRRFEQLPSPQIIHLAELEVQVLQGESPVELPEARRRRIKDQYGVSRLRSEFLCDDKDRADFFEAAVQAGAEPLTAAHWIASEITRMLNQSGQKISEMKITPEHYAYIIKKFADGEIHSATAKHLLQTSFKTGSAPSSLLKTLHLTEIAGEKELLPYVRKAITENKNLCDRLKNGEMAPLEFLTGEVMKATNNKAVPQIVKSLIKQELNISIVYILAMGGAISAVRHDDGTVTSGDSNILRTMADKCVPGVPVQVISVGQFLSEEIEPGDWASLIAEISARISAGIANGIVVTHGRDTLSYTSALLYWLFSDAQVPVVLTASSSLPSESTESEENLTLAIKTAAEKKTGVYVAFGGRILSPLNLRFERQSRDGFRNWNLNKQVFTESGSVAALFADISEPDRDVMERLLTEASGKMLICRIYPGFRSDLYKKMLEEQIHTVFLELYEAGTGDMRSNDFSLKPLLMYGKQKNVRFYCTSQQETNIDFSQYITSLRVWREGAVPMGCLTTESAVALYLACSLVADTTAELDDLMETYGNQYSGK